MAAALQLLVSHVELCDFEESQLGDPDVSWRQRKDRCLSDLRSEPLERPGQEAVGSELSQNRT